MIKNPLFIKTLLRRNEISDIQEVQSSFLLSMKSNTSFREARHTETRDDGGLDLIHIIRVPSSFHYANLNGLSAKSIERKKKIQKYCCKRTGVSWTYLPEEKSVRIDALVYPSRGSERALLSIEKAVELLREWLDEQCSLQGVQTDA